MKTGFRGKPMSANFRLLVENARNMREHPTEIERLMWSLLSANKFGVNFRRQHIIGDYIVDFDCLSKGLIIEVDGEYHNADEQKEIDAIRTQWLEKQGFTVIRFTNEQVTNNMDYVIQTIENRL